MVVTLVLVTVALPDEAWATIPELSEAPVVETVSLPTTNAAAEFASMPVLFAPLVVTAVLVTVTLPWPIAWIARVRAGGRNRAAGHADRAAGRAGVDADAAATGGAERDAGDSDVVGGPGEDPGRFVRRWC